MRDPTRPCVEETYSGALESSDLSVRPSRGSIDYIIAAGWVRDGLGASLYRLRTEWDAVRADLRQADDNARAGARAAAHLERYANTAAADEEDAERKRQAAAIVRQQAEDAALTARALALAHLKTLSSTTAAVHNYAVALGARTRFYNLDAVHAVASRALQLWLDPNCPHCEGRGFTGGHLVPVKWCQECDHTGRRINGAKGFRMAQSDRGHEFGRALLVDMDRKCERVVETMKLYLFSSRLPDAEWGESEALALRKRLAELRSSDAERD